MRNSFERAGQMMGLIAALSGESEADAKPKKTTHEQHHSQSAEKDTFTRKDFSLVLPSEFKAIPTERRSVMAGEVISLLSTSPSASIQEAWNKLPVTTRESLYLTVFEEGRLTGNATMGAILKWEHFLDPAIQVAFNKYAAKLKGEGLPVPDYNELKGVLTAKAEKNPKSLKRFFDVLTNSLRAPNVPSPLTETFPIPQPEIVPPPTPEAPLVRTPEPTASAEPVAPTPTVEAKQPGIEASPATHLSPSPEQRIKIPAEYARYINRGLDAREQAFPGHFHIQGHIKKIAERDPQTGKEILRSAAALTFDDGLDLENTPKILETLQAEGIRATFYLQGIYITERYRDVLNRMLDAGHEIGLHSLNHSDIKHSKLPLDEIYQQQVIETENRLRKLSTTPQRPEGYTTKLYRPAYGSISREQIAEFSKPGHDKKIINWSVDTEDRGSQTAETMIDLVGNYAQHNDIVLMHSAAGKAHKLTVDALPGMIKKLKERNFAFVTTSEIIGDVPIDPEKVKIAPHLEKAAPTIENPPTTPTFEAPTAPTASVDAGASPSPDQGERVEKVLPSGADAFDKDGYPYGWAFQNHPLYEGDAQPPIPDLVSTTPQGEQPIGLTRTGERKEFSLRKDAFEAFMALRGRLNKEASPEAKALGLFITEGYRTLADQIETKRKYPTKAALPRTSEHELGIAIDITNGQITPLYNYLYGIGKNGTELPPIIASGFIPTALNEPWHARFVGAEAAATYWKKHKTKILDIHTRLRRNEAIVISKN
jgi:peptidoglycan/xylan/chitin deacetylase (PgdA/CDA1 family)